jgi:multidrug resistance protein
MAILPGPTEVATKDIEKDTPSGTLSIDEKADLIAYSIFTQAQKQLITLLIGLAMLFSPLSANIYLPCLPALQLALHSTRQLINLTITSYIVLQGIAPAFFGDLADTIGRRPVYLATFAIYVAASLGLALQNNYAALLTLRMLQSLGCSATVAIGYGVIADVVPPSQRGSMLGPAMVATNLGPSLGPLIGGLLTDRAGWRWVFWFLLVMGAAFLLALILFFPETSRKLVGNGSIEPTGWNRTLVSRFHSPRGTVTGRSPDEHLALRPTGKLTLPNPFHSLRLIFYKDTALVLSVSAIYYTVYYCVQASLPGIFVDVYGYNKIQIGLCYLAMGIGVVMGGYTNGTFTMCFESLRRTCQRIGYCYY